MKTEDSCSKSLNAIIKMSFDFENNKCFVNGHYYGEIISKTEHEMKVKVDNGNRFMKHEIVTINY